MAWEAANAAANLALPSTRRQREKEDVRFGPHFV